MDSYRRSAHTLLIFVVVFKKNCFQPPALTWLKKKKLLINILSHVPCFPLYRRRRLWRSIELITSPGASWKGTQAAHLYLFTPFESPKPHRRPLRCCKASFLCWIGDGVDSMLSEAFFPLSSDRIGLCLVLKEEDTLILSSPSAFSLKQFSSQFWGIATL